MKRTATYDIGTAAQDALNLAGHLSRIVAYRKSGNELDEHLDMVSAIDELRDIASALGFEIVGVDEPSLQRVAA